MFVKYAVNSRLVVRNLEKHHTKKKPIIFWGADAYRHSTGLCAKFLGINAGFFCACCRRGTPPQKIRCFFEERQLELII